MGFEPTTFCMANASSRSLPFAPVRSQALFAAASIQTSEPERTRANAEPCHPCHAAGRGITGVGELRPHVTVDPSRRVNASSSTP
jgi:hypothetical protein